VAQNEDKRLLEAVADVTRQLRHGKGISQEKFYEDTGINIARIELAKRNVTIITLKHICAHLGVSLRDFFHKVEKVIASS
jgi:transcriptional regulator with XRE-family HTH domain